MVSIDNNESISMFDLKQLAKSYTLICDRVQHVAERSGRSPTDITIVAVSKTQPLAAVQALYDLGHRHFGENRVDEAYQKIHAARDTFAPGNDPIIWHMIGHIQSRKAKTVVECFDYIHSVDSMRLAQRLSRFATAQAKTMPLLLECNVSGEASKHGFAASQCEENTQKWATLTEAVNLVMELPYLEICGLMTMAPIVQQQENVRPYFVSLRDLSNRLTKRFPDTNWQQLSMGMTNDFEVAIEEGATMLRVGQAIFGERH